MKSNAAEPSGISAPAHTAVATLSRSEQVRSGRRHNKPFTPEIADSIAEDRKDVYFGSLAMRLLTHLRRRMEYDKTRYKPEVRLSWANIARQTSIPYRTLVHYLIYKDRPMPIAVLDALLWASKTSLLDLFTPVEIASYIKTMDLSDRTLLTSTLKKALDNAREKAQTQVSAAPTGSQS